MEGGDGGEWVECFGWGGGGKGGEEWGEKGGMGDEGMNMCIYDILKMTRIGKSMETKCESRERRFVDGKGRIMHENPQTSL